MNGSACRLPCQPPVPSPCPSRPPRPEPMRLLSRSLLALTAPIATAVALLAAVPAAAHASSIFTTFTDRAKYLAEVSTSGYTNRQVDVGGASDASNVDGVGVSTTGGIMQLGAFGGSQALWLYPTEAGNSFTFTPGAGTYGFGFEFLAADGPGSASVSVSFANPGFLPPSEEAASDGTASAGNPATFELQADAGRSFFGVVVRDGMFPWADASVASVTITTSAMPTVVPSMDVATAASTVPEPATYALMGTGLLALAGTSLVRRRRAS